MATNINQIIFTRTQPKKKLEIINSLSEAELMATTEATITKIVKEAGSRLYKIRDKQLRIDYDRRKGNNWNSTVESVELIKGKLYLDFYIQYENTDTNTSEEYDNFFRRGNFRGRLDAQTVTAMAEHITSAMMRPTKPVSCVQSSWSTFTASITTN